jgi:signal transduction histidine kinase
MATSRRNRLVYGVLIAVWAMILVWQAVEHSRVRRDARVALINRAKDISTTLGVVLRSQRHFGIISKDRLETALTELIKPEELTAVAMLNAAGDIVASAGVPIDFEVKGLVPTGLHWGRHTVTLMNLVDLGTNLTSEVEGARPPLVLPREEMFPPLGTNRFGTNRPPRGPPPPGDEPPRQPDRDRPESAGFSAPPSSAADTDAPPPPPRRRGPRRGPDGAPTFGRPFWMSETEYKEAIQKQGVHSFVMVLSTASVQATTGRDLWQRWIINLLAAISVIGLGMAWRNLARSSELEVRLVRAAELNTRLKEMNFAAAGLAHETKNPLNIIRGLAQMISKRDDAPEEVRQKSCGIVEEADRVAAQLNEFINFSRPREVRRVNVALNAVVNDVLRALGHDLEDKTLRVTAADNLPGVEADEQLLRQALFNLLLNATQAVERGGQIEVVATKLSATEGALEIRDNGPGVPAEQRADIFKPYFTTNSKGTGLGLAVVQQIVLAHGWEIECLPNEPRGAVFRISHLRLASGA